MKYIYLSIATLLVYMGGHVAHVYADEQDVLNRLDRVERDLITIQQGVFQRGDVKPSFKEVDTVDAPSFEVRLLQIEEQLRQLQGKIERLEFRLQQQQSALPATVPASPLPSSSSSAELPVPDSNPVPSDPNALYNKAFSYLQKSDYNQAEKYLLLFAERYPQHMLASNAYYWLGETYYVQKQYEQAAVQFLKGYQDFPKGSKAADSLLKLALSLVNLKKKEEACTTLHKLTTEFTTLSHAIRQRVERETRQLQCQS